MVYPGSREDIAMFVDFAPTPNPLAPCAIVVEETDKPYRPGFADEVIQTARVRDATTADGDEIFWVVFAEEPKRLWDFTERSLRSELR